MGYGGAARRSPADGAGAGHRRIALVVHSAVALIRFGLPRANPAEIGPRSGQIQRAPTHETQEQIRADPVDPHDPRPIQKRINWGALRTPRVLGMLALLFLSACAVDLILVVQGTWARAAFGANEADQGQVFVLLGVAELAGSLGATVLVDRVGKKRAVLAGYTLTALAMAALPLSEGSWVAFLVLFFLFDLCFEFSIVSALPLASGVAPAVRGTVMALSVLTLGLGRALSSRVAEPLWSGYGIWATGLTAAALTLAGVLACLVFVKETEASDSTDNEKGTRKAS
jgi:predicted MFS family arabinose efflux permease